MVRVASSVSSVSTCFTLSGSQIRLQPGDLTRPAALCDHDQASSRGRDHEKWLAFGAPGASLFDTASSPNFRPPWSGVHQPRWETISGRAAYRFRLLAWPA